MPRKKLAPAGDGEEGSDVRDPDWRCSAVREEGREVGGGKERREVAAAVVAGYG
jgi:hypothetical protein